MELGMQGKVAVVAAASQGLGKAVALGFAREGASVVICGRHADKIAATAAEIRQETEARVIGVEADVTRPEEIRRFVDLAVAKFGRIDTLVCNAGGPVSAPFEQLSDEQWEHAIQLNLMSAVRLIRTALPHLKESGTGRIIALASSSIRQPIVDLVLSNTIRLGLHGLVKTLSDELAPYGILVNTVGPGRIDTDRVRSLDEGRAKKVSVTAEEQRRRMEQTIPLGRYGEPEEFARYVVFLGSPANSYVTGQALMVDGGMTRSV